MTTPCWSWKGAVGTHGYATIGRRLVHRFLYEGLFGAIPEGLTLDHLCGNRTCVNPQHYELVTIRENILRGNSPSAHNARKTHCLNGHPFDEVNTYRPRTHRGGRQCRACRATRERTRQAHLRAVQGASGMSGVAR